MLCLGGGGTVPNSVDVLRVPEDVIPTLDVSYYVNGNNKVTLISTGESRHNNGTDIKAQNQGSGQQIISPSAINGETGYHYKDGVALTTRQDSMSEYQVTKRASGQDRINLSQTPSDNLCKHISANHAS